jgi:hypothetical protein
MATLVSQAKYARMRGVSRAAITQWKERGWLEFQGDLVDVDASNRYLKKYRPGGLPNPGQDEQAVKQPVKRVSLKNGPAQRLTRREVIRRLKELDFTQTFTWTREAKEQRAIMAARSILWDAVEEEGRRGYFQLRLRSGSELDGVPVRGFDFGLSASDVLHECRDDLTPEDDSDAEEEVVVHLSLLHWLAYPFWESQKPK